MCREDGCRVVGPKRVCGVPRRPHHPFLSEIKPVDVSVHLKSPRQRFLSSLLTYNPLHYDLHFDGVQGNQFKYPSRLRGRPKERTRSTRSRRRNRTDFLVLDSTYVCLYFLKDPSRLMSRGIVTHGHVTTTTTGNFVTGHP